MGRWLERYQRGEHRQVWMVLTSAGPALRAEAGEWADAQGVARETMRRARANVERLVERLPALGFVFEHTPHVPPPADVANQLDALEAEIGALPLALRTWFEEVGQVDLTGRHPDWTFDFPDPLVVDAPIDYIRSEFEELGATGFEVPIAPDYLHKANVSGGAPYALAVPNGGVDGLLRWEAHQTTFVNYLRIAFALGGMPGWGIEPGLLPEWALPPEPPPAWLVALGGELLPL